MKNETFANDGLPERPRTEIRRAAVNKIYMNKITGVMGMSIDDAYKSGILRPDNGFVPVLEMDSSGKLIRSDRLEPLQEGEVDPDAFSVPNFTPDIAKEDPLPERPEIDRKVQQMVADLFAQIKSVRQQGSLTEAFISENSRRYEADLLSLLKQTEDNVRRASVYDPATIPDLLAEAKKKALEYIPPEEEI